MQSIFLYGKQISGDNPVVSCILSALEFHQNCIYVHIFAFKEDDLCKTFFSTVEKCVNIYVDWYNVSTKRAAIDPSVEKSLKL